MTNMIKYTTDAVFIWSSASALFLMGCNAAHRPPFQKKIKSKEELENIVKEEAEKLKLDSSKIDINYGSTKFSATKVGDRYKLSLKKGGFLATRKLVRHELYHMLKDCDKEDGITEINYQFIAEPRALIYGAFGIKL
jgi:hypothetical protein